MRQNEPGFANWGYVGGGPGAGFQSAPSDFHQNLAGKRLPPRYTTRDLIRDGYLTWRDPRLAELALALDACRNREQAYGLMRENRHLFAGGQK